MVRCRTLAVQHGCLCCRRCLIFRDRVAGTFLATSGALLSLQDIVMPQRKLLPDTGGATRRSLPRPTRADRDVDGSLDRLVSLSGELLRERGVFQVGLHFAGGQLALWELRDPCHYRVWPSEDCLRPGFAEGFRQALYPVNAGVPPGRVQEVLSRLKSLRLDEGGQRLCSGSLNIINGTVGLDFSCAGSLYLDYRDLLD
jgi:hypothetical protein